MSGFGSSGFGNNNNNLGGFGAGSAGGGFGGFAPTAPPPFGAPPAQSSSFASSGGFGVGATPSFGNAGIGNAPNTTPVFAFSSTFGQPQQAPFGSNSSTPTSSNASPGLGFGTPGNTATSGFGSSAGFGSSSNTSFGFSSAPTPSPAPAMMFGAPTSFGAAPAPSSSFGASTAFGTPAQTVFSQPAFPTSMASSSSATSFSSNPFGSTSATTPTGFGPSNATSGGFGSSTPSFAASASGFGSMNQSSFVSNPFGSSVSAPAPAMIFGTSSNVMMQDDDNMQDGNNSSGFGNFGQSSFASGPFVSSTSFPSSNSAFAATSSAFAPSPSLPAPSPSFVAPSPAFGFAAPSPSFATTPSFSPFAAGGSESDDDMGGTTSPVPEANMSPTPPDQATSSQSVNKSSSQSTSNYKEQELAQLKAKLAEKKKKLEQAKLLKQHQGDGAIPPSSGNSSSASSSRGPSGNSLAERNALRFATNKVYNTQAHLPDDLKASSNALIATTTTDEEVINVHSAKSLVGTCQHMCPDDELQRREREGDIQLLEQIHPDLHPPDWNLRDTAVKRFRRSAADYKLDVPEWIRTPDVLERTVSYLEEWVMERDRQGIDPRFQQTPAPLDVYQFIWDRTRMVRKDFILQNYVGTGGNCDARAVRCHERIARWHAMCEHQLSHIPDFIRMQSQQNIAEMGQTLKTLNLLYDDSLHRAAVDVPDDQGQETRINLAGISHGIESNIVIGIPPVDYDGQALRNDEMFVTKRIIGAKNAPARGTAEPEMRALYILLTIENDGGMEVLKYAAKLSRDHPEVFRSRPVQLSLEIFKAKHEMNYARFFSIIRAPTTPYLFACLMFKYVEEMRRVAIRIMHLTYGYKKKDSEAYQDHYPLRSLARLLCFEDMEEARTTCEHYNITVKAVELPSSSSPTGKKKHEFIFWRASRFMIPRDEAKGVAIPIKPRKMMRTIESKLNGVTRLAVCRGEVSGEGSILSVNPSEIASALLDPAAAAAIREKEKERQACEQLDQQKRREEAAAKQEEIEKKKKLEEERRRKEELMRKLEEKRRQTEAAKKKEEEEAARLREEHARKAAMDEKCRQQEEQRRIAEEEEARRKAAAAALERQQVLEKLAAEKRAREEEKKKKALELEQKRAREAVEAAMRQAKFEEEQRAKLAEEKSKQEKLEAERKRKAQEEEEARAIKAAEESERRAKLEKEKQRINRAKKSLLWKIIRNNLREALVFSRISTSLRAIDSTFSSPAPSTYISEPYESLSSKMLVEEAQHMPLCDFFETLGLTLSTRPRVANPVILLKLSILLPQSNGMNADSFHSIIHNWIDSRVGYNHVHRVNLPDTEIRFVVVNGVDPSRVTGSDAILFVFPPFMEGMNFFEFPEHVARPSSFSESTPKFALNMDDGRNKPHRGLIQSQAYDLSVSKIISVAGDEASDFDQALAQVLSDILGTMPSRYKSLEVTSISRLTADILEETLCAQNQLSSPEVALDNARNVLADLSCELVQVLHEISSSGWKAWPPLEFISDGVVSGYFAQTGDLPSSWIESLRSIDSRLTLLPKLEQILQGTFDDAMYSLLLNSSDAQITVCQSLAAHRQHQRCLQVAISAYCADRYFTDDDTLVFLPFGKEQDLLNVLVKKQQKGAEPRSPGTTIAMEREREFSALIHNQLDLDLSEPFKEDATAEKNDSLFAPIPDNDNQSFLPSLRQKRLNNDEANLGCESESKRRRGASPTVRENSSSAISDRLEAMMHGDIVVDMEVGELSLRELLVGAPAIEMEPSRRVSETHRSY